MKVYMRSRVVECSLWCWFHDRGRYFRMVSPWHYQFRRSPVCNAAPRWSHWHHQHVEGSAWHSQLASPNQPFQL